MRREDARRRLRRAHTHGPLVYDLDRGAASSQLMRNRAADHSRADDDNV
jgi:hypothetical protein